MMRKVTSLATDYWHWVPWLFLWAMYLLWMHSLHTDLIAPIDPIALTDPILPIALIGLIPLIALDRMDHIAATPTIPICLLSPL